MDVPLGKGGFGSCGWDQMGVVCGLLGSMVDLFSPTEINGVYFFLNSPMGMLFGCVS